MQDKVFCMKVSDAFLKGIRRAQRKANEPSLSEWIKRTMIREAEKYGVKVKR